MQTIRSLRDVHSTIARLIDSDRECLLAVVLETRGSTPSQVGARAIIDAAGIVLGTVGGGKVEAEVLRQAPDVLATRKPIVLNFELNGVASSDDRPICGGAVRVLMIPLDAEHCQVLATAAAIQRRRQRGVLLTTIHSAETPEVSMHCLTEDVSISNLELPNDATVHSVMRSEVPRHCTLTLRANRRQCEALIEPIVAQPMLVLAGGGHIGQAVARLATWIGFDVTVIDDRPAFTRPDLFPDDTAIRCGDIHSEITALPLRSDSYVVIVTRGHRSDAEALTACIHQPVAYIGMIGSQKKVALMRSHFIESGLATASEFDRVHAPIGLPIGAVTVPEIAASIVAELIAVRRQRLPATDQFTNSPS